MRVCNASLKSLSPYSQSRPFQSERGDGGNSKESADEFEKRAWRERIHQTEAGEVFIPPMSFTYALVIAVKRLGLKVPGRKGATFTKYFQSGIMVQAGPTLGVKAADVPGEWVYCHANGQRGSGTRVYRCFPLIKEWQAAVEFTVLDDTIPQDVFEMVLKEAGIFVGLGRFRPENLGYYGRFVIAKTEWTEQ